MSWTTDLEKGGKRAASPSHESAEFEFFLGVRYSSFREQTDRLRINMNVVGVVTDTNNALLDTVAGTYGVSTNLETGVSC